MHNPFSKKKRSRRRNKCFMFKLLRRLATSDTAPAANVLPAVAALDQPHDTGIDLFRFKPRIPPKSAARTGVMPI